MASSSGGADSPLLTTGAPMDAAEGNPAGDMTTSSGASEGTPTPAVELIPSAFAT